MTRLAGYLAELSAGEVSAFATSGATSPHAPCTGAAASGGNCNASHLALLQLGAANPASKGMGTGEAKSGCSQ